MKSKIYQDKSRNGEGIFARQLIRKGEEIIEFHGPRLKPSDLPVPYDSVEDHYVQIGAGLYMGPSGEGDDLINHSCNPNSGLVIKDWKIILIATKDITGGEEITWDYSTTMDEDDWEVDCLCGSGNCRGKIRDFKYLPDDVKKRYIQLGIVPQYNLKYAPRGIVIKK